MSEYYAVIRSTDYLAHYGVKGMKWGVRKFAKDKYARPSEKFISLYGDKSSKKVGPRTIQRHFNAIDKSATNIIAKQRGKEIEFADVFGTRTYVVGKKNRALKQKNVNNKKINRYNKSIEKIDKNLGSIMDKGVKYATQVKNLESMMDAMAAKATNSGYSVKSKSKLRMPYVYIKTRGAIGVMPVSGQRVKIRKNGNGQATFTMYKEHGDGTPHDVNLTTGSITSKKKKRK